MKYRWSDGWLLSESGEAIVLSAGADLELETEPLSKSARERIAAWPQSGEMVMPKDLELSTVFRQCVTLGVLEPILGTSLERVRPIWLGCRNDALAKQLDLQQGRNWGGDVTDFTVVFRTTDSWREAVSSLYEVTLGSAHLFVDLAYHHSVAIGPLVLPGETACVECLAGRVVNRWGDGPVPKSPEVLKDSSLVAALVDWALRRIASTSTWGINKITTWNLEDGSNSTDLLLRVPDCPGCDYLASVKPVDLSEKSAE